MEVEKKLEGIPFKDFLDKSTNLITIFGIFNALFVYSASIENKDAASFLLPTFFFLSLFIWFEIIVFSMDSNDGTWKYEMFYYFACSIEIGLVWYFISIFASLLFLVVYYGILLLLSFLLVKMSVLLLKKKLFKMKENIRRLVVFFLFFISIIITGSLLKLTKPLITPLINNTNKAKSEKENINVQKEVFVKDTL